MSASELLKSTMANDSSIPVLKRNLTGAKKSKPCSKSPDLQRYIETIIKARNEFDSESASLSDKEKFTKGKQFGKHTVCRGLENKIKHEKLKFDMISNRCKNKTHTNKKYSEAVSKDEVFRKFVSEFEDPRNWKTQNSGSHLKIEKLMKKFYPNPYKICCENEYQNSETHLIFEKVNKDDLYYDIIISKIDAETQDLEKSDILLVSADNRIISRERAEKITDDDMGLIYENLNRFHNISRKKKSKDSKCSIASKSNKISNTLNKSSRIKHNNSASNASSRVSSLESINQVLYKENQLNLKKKNFKATTKAKETFPKGRKSKPLTPDDKNQSDYDIGKLNFLNLSDSDDSTSSKLPFEQIEIKNENNITTDDFVSEISSEICNEISKTNDLNDLLQIYEVMNKATESFLYLTSIKKSCSENKKSAETSIDSHDLGSDYHNREDARILKANNSEVVEDEKHSATNKENKSSKRSLVENNSDSSHDEEEKAVENISLNVLIKREKRSVEEKNFDKEENSKPGNEKLENLRDSQEEILRFLNLHNCKNLEKKTDDEIFDANQKISEVLQFMNECLLNFGNEKKLLHQELKNFKENLLEDTGKDVKRETASRCQEFRTSSYDFTDEDSIKSYSQKNSLIPEETQSDSFTALEKTNIRIRCKRKSEIFTPIIQTVEKKNTSSQELSVSSNERATTSHFEIHPALYAESTTLNNENTVLVAESQNELGGYTEEIEESTVINNESSGILKSLIPFSTKVKRSLPDTYMTLKNALETEEKLLAGCFGLNRLEPEELIFYKPSQLFIQNDITTCYSPLEEFDRVNPSFVICFSPFPQNLRSEALIVPSFSIPRSLPLSLIDLRSWNLKPLWHSSKKHSMEKVSISRQTRHGALEFMYRFKLEALWIVNNTYKNYCVIPVCFTSLICFPRVQKESLEYSKRQITVKPLKKSSVVKLSSYGTSEFCIKNTLTFTTGKSSVVNAPASRINMNSTDEPMEALIKAIQETENVFLLHQANISGNNLLEDFESLCNCKTTEMLKNEASENELEKEKNKKKIQSLLQRTYKLQKKLQQYLYVLSQVQPASLSCSLVKQDLGVTIKEKDCSSDVLMTNVNIKSEKSPLLQKFLQPSESDKNSKTDEAVTVNVEMVDCGTTYSPPLEVANQGVCEESDESSYKRGNSSREENDERNNLNLENDEDDRSSTYSFKSSNDFSETNEIQNLIQESSSLMIKREPTKKIFCNKESLKQSVGAENFEKQEKRYSDKENNSNIIKKKDESNEKKLAEFDPKNPAKVLKTVFKGKKSSTELTIGLKDVPMTKVSNISVEKTKFSPNHTKISICISKEKPNKINNLNNLNAKMLPNKVSSYFLDHMRPSLSTCQTEYSKVTEGIISKSSQSVNEGTDVDEDDFKSAGSTFADSGTGDDREKLKPENQTNKAVLKMPPSRSFTKHKFDFYRKMDMNVEGIRVRQKPLTNSLWRFKELEPLKQALTELQIRMRSIKREAILNSNDYYERALKLAKMSAGYCQSCGTRAVIPDDTFGYYRTLLPQRHTQHRRSKHFKTTVTPNSSFYSLQSSNTEVNQFCDLDIKRSSSFSLNRTTHSKRTVLKSSLKDMPIHFKKFNLEEKTI